jgi:hypothetical protein
MQRILVDHFQRTLSLLFFNIRHRLGMHDIKIGLGRRQIINHLDEQHNTELPLPDDSSETKVILEIDVIVDF